ncbi:MAG: hypothetical protein J6Y94_03935 [Bacteriovoracaceae bacterium]|nr:hypothetical protein [Bacteriovoracaceae bacterium]
MRFLSWISLFTVLSLAACSSISENTVSQGTIYLKGGRSATQSWSDSLKFTRHSWYQGLTLVLDFWTAPLDKDSPFLAWASASEQRMIQECPDFRIGMYYAFDAEKISENMLTSALKAQGVDVWTMNNLATALKNHPNFDPHMLSIYRIRGLCVLGQDFTLSFPNFAQEKIAR